MSPKAQVYYPTDLTDGQWQVIEPLLPEARSGAGKPGRPPYPRRRLVNAIRYVAKTGCQWRQLPRDFGCWQTVYGYFNRWSRATVWQGIMEELNALERRRQQRLQPRRPERGAGLQAVGRMTSPTADESLLALIDQLSSLLERSELTELEVQVGSTGLVLRKPSAVAPQVVVGAGTGAPAGQADGAATGAGAAAPSAAAADEYRADLLEV